MNNIKRYKIAFIGWNPFQYIHIKDLAIQIGKCDFIVEDRGENLSYFKKKSFLEPQFPINIYKKHDIKKLDGVYDIIITLNLFQDIHLFRKTKIVMLQYGYAKEMYNYGLWRSLSSLFLVYGSYAYKKVSFITPTVIVGNPRYKKCHNLDFHLDMKNKYSKYIDPHKKTILYMPTWGSLSSYNKYISTLKSLIPEYNLIIKLHHNSEIFVNNHIKRKKDILYFGKYYDNIELLLISDIVISDYSGAIFDALYCKKPIVLLDVSILKLLFNRKLNINSLEIKYRNKIGIKVSKPSELSSKIEEAITNKFYKSININSELFMSSNNAIENIINSLNNLMLGKYKKNSIQLLIYTCIKLYMKIKYLLQKALA